MYNDRLLCSQMYFVYVNFFFYFCNISIYKCFIPFYKHFMDYKDKIDKIMQSENLNATQFANEIGIQSSTLSHVLNGRNNPSLDLLTKILNRFPKLSPDWLFLGKGPMFRQESNSQMPSLFDFEPEENLKSDTYTQKKETETISTFSPIQNEAKEIAPEKQQTPKIEQNLSETPQNKPAENIVPKERKIEKIIVYYSDRTYEDFLPK